MPDRALKLRVAARPELFVGIAMEFRVFANRSGYVPCDCFLNTGKCRFVKRVAKPCVNFPCGYKLRGSPLPLIQAHGLRLDAPRQARVGRAPAPRYSTCSASRCDFGHPQAPRTTCHLILLYRRRAAVPTAPSAAVVCGTWV